MIAKKAPNTKTQVPIIKPQVPSTYDGNGGGVTGGGDCVVVSVPLIVDGPVEVVSVVVIASMTVMNTKSDAMLPPISKRTKV